MSSGGGKGTSATNLRGAGTALGEEGFIACHHVEPLSQLQPGQTTKVSELAW